MKQEGPTPGIYVSQEVNVFEMSAIKKKMMIGAGTPLFYWSGCQTTNFLKSFLKPTWIFKTFIYLSALGLGCGTWDVHCGVQTSVVVA